jgi:hypothetical protein
MHFAFSDPEATDILTGLDQTPQFAIVLTNDASREM